MYLRTTITKVFMFHHDPRLQLYLDGVVDNLLPAAQSFLLKNYGTEEIANQKWELMVSLRMYGLALGCFLSIILAQFWGRKSQVLLGLVLNILGVLLTSIVMYIPGGLTAAHIGRLVNGCGQGICQTAGTVMLLELPPKKNRGTVLATMTFFACFGEFLSMLLSLDELLGNADRWHWAMAVPIVLLLPAVVVIYHSPESPRFLFMEGRHVEAECALEYYQADQDINANTHLSEKKNYDLISGMRIELSVWTRLSEGTFLRPLLVACVLQMFVHLDDWLWISYSTHIFALHGLNDSLAQKASLLMTLPQAALSLGLVSVFEKFSRKSLVVLPTLGSAFIGVATIMTIHHSPHGSAPTGIFTCILPFLASLDLCMAAIAGEGAFTVAPELFLYKDRIIGNALCGIVQSLFGGVLLNCLLSAINHLGADKVMIPFVFCNLFYVAFTAYYVPETANKSPQEVSESLERIFNRRRLIVDSLQSLTDRFSISGVAVLILQIMILLLALNLAFTLVNYVLPLLSVSLPQPPIIRALRNSP